MRGYNDYVFLTKRYLKSYTYLKKSVEFMKGDIEALETELKLGVAAPIAKYGDEPRGGCPELNTVETAVDKRIRLKNRIDALREDILTTQRLLDKVDRALQSLDVNTKHMVMDHYYAGMGWEEVGDRYHYSGKRAGEIGRKALENVALMLFGIKARPVQLSFVFAT